MKTRNWLWLLLAAMVCTFVACDDNSPSTPPEWAVNGGSINLTPSDHELSRDEAWKLVKEMVLCDNLKDIAVQASKSIIQAGDSIRLSFWPATIPVPVTYRSWVFFIDDHLDMDWTHPCRYVLVAVNGSYIEVVNRDATPLDFENYEYIVRPTPIVSQTMSLPIVESRNALSVRSNQLSAKRCYAILINGGYNKQNNQVRFWNGISAIYTILVNNYGYLKTNIRVLMSDGFDSGEDQLLPNGSYISSSTDLDNDGIADITSSATRENLSSVFRELATKITEEDELLVFIGSHGGFNIYGEAYLPLWNQNIMYPSELNNYLGLITAKQIQVIISACHSGGFISTLESNNRIITTACKLEENGYATNEYSWFTYHWLSAMIGKIIDSDDDYVYANTNMDNIVSYYEAYSYTYDKLLDRHSDQHAQYSSTPTTLGLTRGLKPESLYAINGDSRFCSQAVYNIPGLPSGANVEWNVTYSEKNPNNDSQLSQSSFTSTGSTLTLSRTAPATYNIGARITYSGLTEDISKKVSCGACSPYNGIMYWESDLLNGSVQFNYNTGGPEFEVDVEQDFVVTSYVDFAGNVIVPTIDYIMSPDIIQDDCSGNTSSLTFGFSGEGEMEVYLLNNCANNSTEYPFIVPYIVFDPNSYSLQLDGNTSTLNIASQTTTYGLRNENPIRTIEVRTYDRQTLLTFNVEDDQTNVADIDISTLSPGTYILKVTDDTVHYLKLMI